MDGDERKRLVSSHLGRTSSIIEFSRLSDSGETRIKVNGTRKVGSATGRAGKKKKKTAALSLPSFLQVYFFFAFALSHH